MVSPFILRKEPTGALREVAVISWRLSVCEKVIREFLFHFFFQVWNGLCDCNSFTTEAKHEVTSLSESPTILLIEKSKGKGRFLKENLLNIFIHFNKLYFHEFSSHSSVLLCGLDAELLDARSRLCDWGHRQRTCGSIHPLKAFSKT